MKQIKVKSETAKLKFLLRCNRAHTIERTKSTTKIRTTTADGKAVNYLHSQSPLDYSELGFIRAVKTAAQKSRTAPEGNTAKSISYFSFKDLPAGTYTGVCEVDVNAAYWQIAKNRGIIPADVYQKGLTVSKRARIVALGALATQKQRWEYLPERGKYEMLEPIVNPRLRSYFFDIAKELDNIMAEALQHPKVLFYWVDAFFLEASHAHAVTEKMAEYGLPVKYKPIDRIEVAQLKSGRKVAEVYDPAKDLQEAPPPRPFFFSGQERENAEFIIKCIVGTIKNLK